MSRSKLPSLDLPRKLLAVGCMLLAFAYPGQNMLQTVVIEAGTKKSYDLTNQSLSLYPQNDSTPPPALSARGVVVQDVSSKTILFAKGADTELSPASTTKLMTALISRDTWSDLNKVIKVQNEDRAIGQSVGLFRGEELTLHSVLQGLLIQSGNDAALALADNFPGGYSAFVAAMNEKAKSLHLDRTVYKNPSGIDQYGHLTSPRDLAILAIHAISDPLIEEIVATRVSTIKDITGLISHPLETTNELLGVVPGLKGLKTGWTTRAGECLISYIERDGHKVIIVVLGSSDRFGETARLVDWVYAHHEWITPNIDTSI